MKGVDRVEKGFTFSDRQHHLLHSPHLKIPRNHCSTQLIHFHVEVMFLLSELILKSCCHLLSATREHYRIFISTYIQMV